MSASPLKSLTLLMNAEKQSVVWNTSPHRIFWLWFGSVYSVFKREKELDLGIKHDKTIKLKFHWLMMCNFCSSCGIIRQEASVLAHLLTLRLSEVEGGGCGSMKLG